MIKWYLLPRIFFRASYLLWTLYIHPAMQSQKAVSAYFTSKQILPFGFAEQYSVTVATQFVEKAGGPSLTSHTLQSVSQINVSANWNPERTIGAALFQC